MSPCPHTTLFVEHLVFLPEKADAPAHVRFGTVNLCAACYAVRSEPKLAYPHDDLVRKAVKAFNGTSWAMMMEAHRHPPYLFVMGSTGVLVPNGYRGPLRNQAELTQDATKAPTPPPDPSPAAETTPRPAQEAERGHDEDPGDYIEEVPF